MINMKVENLLLNYLDQIHSDLANAEIDQNSISQSGCRGFFTRPMVLLNTFPCSMNINVNNNLAFYLTLYYVSACAVSDFQIHYVENIDLSCKWLICVNYYVIVLILMFLCSGQPFFHFSKYVQRFTACPGVCNVERNDFIYLIGIKRLIKQSSHMDEHRISIRLLTFHNNVLQ